LPEYAAALGLAIVMLSPSSCAPQTSGAPKILHAIQGRVSPDQNFLTGLDSVVIISLPRERRRLPAWLVAARSPVSYVLLVRPTDKHRIKYASTQIVRTKAKRKPKDV
jgi:hypothetical protein